MFSSLEQRLRRLEKASVPSQPMQAVVITAPNRLDAERQFAEAVADGRHRPGWPAIIVVIPPETSP